MVPNALSKAPWLTAGRTADFRAGSAAAAALAAVLWHALLAFLVCWWRFPPISLFDSDLLNALGWDWKDRSEVWWKNLYLAGLGLLLIFVIAYVFWRVSRLREPHAITPPWFFICWWRSCLLGTLVIPAGLVLAWWTLGNEEFGLALIVPYVLFAPAAIAPRVIPTVQRWRPVCPECGHTVAYAVEPRCSECGESYLCPDPYYRRWAIQRAPWDRRQRTLAFAYVRTLVMIVFRPARAAWRLSCPDRLGRAVRWSVGHMLAPAILYAGILAFVFLAMRPPMGSTATPGFVPADTVDRWGIGGMALWLTAWSLAAVVYQVAVGVCLAAATPAVQPAARRGMIKWSLYAGASMLGLGATILVIGLGVEFSRTIAWGWMAAGIMPLGAMLFAPNPGDVLLGLNLLYGVWWAIGVASQPYLRRRGFGVFLVALAAFSGVLGLILRLFDLRGLGGLL